MYRKHSADEVTREIGLCRRGKSRVEIDDDIKEAFCIACQWSFSQLQKLIGHGMQPDTFIQSAVSYCHTFGDPYSSICKHHAIAYLSALWDVVAYRSAEDGCEYINAC